MSLMKKIVTMAAPIALLSLGACATPFRADVARFQQMPAPQGQSFTIRASDPRLQGGLEFGQYATLVSQRLTAQGYQPAANPAEATLVVNLDYGVDNGQEKVITRPGFGSWGGWGPYYPRRWGHRSAFYYGWNDPFWYSPFGYPEVESYRYYTSHLEMTINRAADGQRLFEGKAKARSLDDSLPRLVPNLVEAMFTGFPGRSGEEVRITVPPPKKG
ncbi:lipoprotein transmembrane [Sphingomonas oleivorans]|uniref:Lipoprotein transmembrane n=1 Tax=Sphingomonas oleivorans TaxID=1735121 RepID=A0A2T5FV34_9SPHN|nr:DUF4136 domain-containing protein [Sphingomonas oleivorans]PTQ08596.1 lipoprotein transmembrane [Sphingomonas oleivorans]